MVLNILPNQLLNLLSLLKCSLQLGQEYIFNRSQFFLDLVLFLAHVDRVKGFKVLQEDVAYVDQTVSIVFLLGSRLIRPFTRVSSQLTLHVFKHGTTVERLRLLFTGGGQLLSEILVMVMNIFHFLLDFAFDLTFHLEEDLQLILG